MLGDVIGYGSGNEVANRLAELDAAADHRRGDRDSGHSEEPGTLAAGNPLKRPFDRLTCRSPPLGDGHRCQLQHTFGSVPMREARGYVAAEDQEQVVVWVS